ncbi:DUF4189 domain-containing protein [Thiofilum flexile]|uniref:DUF4189 domain-containing protein n=1 Tax=Thiofilum flexile TaxID=125627 RepID=UPI000DA1FB4B|nr:DUF4189 domain-containing protein [Thiofilum flexile]
MKKYLFLLISIIGFQFFITSTAHAYIVYSATSFCRATHAVGYAQNKLTRSDALNVAINNCIGNGGVPSCCRSRARISDSYHAALSYCSITGVTGVGVAQTLNHAINKAVSQCIDKGGVRACCRNKISY